MKPVFNKFDQFCARLRILSKEFGVVPLVWWGSQKYYLEQIQKGIEEGVRDFKTNKGRQQGITEVDIAIIPFWMSKYAGTLGAIVTDDGGNLARARTMLTRNMKYAGPNWCVGHDRQGHHNIMELLMDNDSHLSYLVAGKRRKADGDGDLGQGKGINLLAATEVASWSDVKQVDKLTDSLAETHPNRLYLWESTPNGFNHWYDMCQDAKKSVTSRFIFIGWWRKEINACARGSNEYRVYWDGKLTTEESRWVREIKLLYDYQITAEQIAWYRLQLHEKKRGDLNALYQQHPPTEELGWIMSGYRFFSDDNLTEAYKKALDVPLTYHRYFFGADFTDTVLHDTTESGAMLRIWEYPMPSGVYVIGADPAYGYNEDSDQSVVQVFRCYSDRIVQVAEFSARGVRTDQFAWVILHLAGAYRNVMVNLELTGPGQAVLGEMRNVHKRQAIIAGRGGSNFSDVIGGIRHFLFSRQDSLTQSFAYHTKTTMQEKEDMMNNLKNRFETGRCILNSTELLTEMKYFARDGSQLEGRGGANDDLVVGAALAVLAYIRHIEINMVSMNMSYAAARKAEEENKDPNNKMIIDFIEKRGVKMS